MWLLQTLSEVSNAANFELFDKLNWKFVIRLSINLLTIIGLVRFVYYRIYKRTDLFLTFFAFNLIIFLITFLLNKVEMTMGAAFGLFAVFSMLRYRTENISAKDMTYLFVVIAVGLIMAVSRGGWDELLLMGIIIIAFVQLLEGNWIIRREFSQQVYYEKIDLIHQDRQGELIEDLRMRTGLHINRVNIDKIDFLKDSALVTIYYFEKK